MGLTDRRLTGRDVLAKTFQAKTKRGYDPIEVDAYLELVAAQIDMLHGDVASSKDAADTPVEDDAAHTALETDLTAARSELEALRSERDTLSSELATATEAIQNAQAENEQLRSQVTAVAPPPPVPAPTQAVAEAVAEPAAIVEAAPTDDRATEESFELVLRMARRSAEETIAEAHNRADEIVNEAEGSAALIARESDRKAFEAANRLQAELTAVNEEVDLRRSELRLIEGQTAQQQADLRVLAGHILDLAGAEPTANPARESAGMVDLRATETDTLA